MGQMGFFTDVTLCIGCKACEVACKQWNQLPADGFAWSGNSYDNTGELSATSWRHVKFIEQFPEARRSKVGGQQSDAAGSRRLTGTGMISLEVLPQHADAPGRWLMMS